jgi:hypothetical protein
LDKALVVAGWRFDIPIELLRELLVSITDHVLDVNSLILEPPYCAFELVDVPRFVEIERWL